MGCTEEKTLGNESDERAKATLQKHCRSGTLSSIASTRIRALSCHKEAFSFVSSCKKSYRFVFVVIFLISELLHCRQSFRQPVPRHTKLCPTADPLLPCASRSDCCDSTGHPWVNLSCFILLPTLFLLSCFSIQNKTVALKRLSSLNVTAFLQTAVIAIIKLIEPAFP